MKKVFSFFLSSFFLFTLAPLQVEAIGFKISPIRYEVEGKPGDSITRKIQVTNKGLGGKAEMLVQDFLGRDESGSPVFVDTPKGDTSSFTLSSWVNFPEELKFNEEEKKEIIFTIDIPVDAEPGGHYATLFVL